MDRVIGIDHLLELLIVIFLQGDILHVRSILLLLLFSLEHGHRLVLLRLLEFLLKLLRLFQQFLFHQWLSNLELKRQTVIADLNQASFAFMDFEQIRKLGIELDAF